MDKCNYAFLHAILIVLHENVNFVFIYSHNLGVAKTNSKHSSVCKNMFLERCANITHENVKTHTKKILDYVNV